MTMKLGQAKYEQGKKTYFSFKKNQNHFVLRVLPPMGDLAESGKWSVFHRVEFGYTTTDGKLKPFLSPRVVNYDGMVEVESETHKRREALKTQQAQAKATGNAALVEQCTKLLMKYNQDAKHHMNVIDLQGNIGLFKIGHRGYQALKAEIERLRSEGTDPLGVADGRFFVFSRSGSGKDTLYTVKEYKQKQVMQRPDGSKIEVDAPFSHAITDSIVSKLATDAFELDKIYPTVTPEEEYRIVHEGASAVDEILGKRAQKSTTNSASTANSASTDEDDYSFSPELEVSTANLANTFPSEATNYSKSAPTSNLSGLDIATMSDEDFLKKIESGNF